MMRLALPLLLLAAGLLAAETMTVVFAGGKKKTVAIESFDEQGLEVVHQGESKRIPWEALQPESAFRVRKELTSYDDGAARRELAEFAVRLKLYPEALEQLEIALALGGLDEAAFEKRAAEIQKQEVDFLCGRIDTLLASGEHPSTCLAAIKRLKQRYPDHPRNALYEPHIAELVDALAKVAQAKQAAEAQPQDDAELARLRRRIEKLRNKKDAARAKGEKLQAEGVHAAAKGQVSRVTRSLVGSRGAERYYKQVRDLLREMAQLDKRFRIVTEADLQKEWDEMERRLVDCYLAVARIQLSQRNYKGAVPWVRKVLSYDPIHEEALEMVEEIRKNRITFKLSNLTGARPRVTGGTG